MERDAPEGGTEMMEAERLKGRVIDALKGIGCCDFRFGVGQMGLVEHVEVGDRGDVSVRVVPCCIFGMTRLVTSVKEGLRETQGITKLDVDVAWDRVGDRDRMSRDGASPLSLDLKGMAERHGLKAWGSPPRES